MGNCHTVGPNEALVVSGGCCGSDQKQYVIGGWAWAWWCVSQTQRHAASVQLTLLIITTKIGKRKKRMSLEIMTLQPKCEDVETAEGVALTVTGVAQVKVMTDMDLLAVACEQFLGKSVQETKSVVLQTLEGHLRAILGTLTVEAIYQDRDQFAQLVREVAAPDVGRMGIEILSFTIKDVYDKVEYLSSLGKSQTAIVQRDAEIGVAEAERDAGIREAECKKEAMDVKYSADTMMADSKRAFEMQKAAFNQEINIKKAEAQLAYELQGAKEQQKIRQEEIEIEVVQRKKQIDIEEKEITRMDKELIGTVKRPAEAEAFRMQQVAEGHKVKQVLIAQAQAEKIRKIGEAEASSISAIGKADAERMRLKAAAYQQYGNAAKMALVLDALPKIAAEVTAPLAKTDEIVILGGDNNRVTSEVTRLLAEVPASVHALTGVDLTKVPLIQKLTNAQA
ncbi:flotillin-2 isoform X1 [Stegostoma tigrinum]|uniref:flotillin-2 isoform X1 n=1 Tax=Stegostoma tigrinum TaxID=3053191 RepID=UPI0028703FC8|nr:flotillin-2 isoform X1 [Stegostoma tigrinum]